MNDRPNDQSVDQPTVHPIAPVGDSRIPSPPLQTPRTGGVRFAPSPTGRFHIGNLRTAWISHLFAKSLGLPWVVRFEDIDQPRVLAGAAELQLQDMAQLGLEADLILTQSHHRLRHWQLFLRAVEEGAVYPCDCSRKEVQEALASLASAPHSQSGMIYSGRCRHPNSQKIESNHSIAWRFKMPQAEGKDDFIVARTAPISCRTDLSESFVPAYHWACAIDDYDGGYDLLVRSIDLKPALSLQRAIHDWICTHSGDRPRPSVFHTALVVQNDGHRLEKRTQGVTLPEILNTGLSVEEVLTRFQSSWNELWQSEDFDHQETPDRLSLSELGFTNR